MKCFSILVRCSLFVACCGSSFAAIVWSQTTSTQAALSPDGAFHASFGFRNTGDQPVEILKVESSCDCTVAAVKSAHVATGSSGSVDVTFSPGARKGPQRKTVMVETSDGQRSILTLAVDIPETVRMDAKEVTWLFHDSLAPKMIGVTVDDPSTAKVASAASLGTNFKATLSQLAPKSYRIEIVPLSTAVASNELIKVEVEDPLRRAIYVKARVMPGQ